MAVAFDALGAGANGSAVTSISWTHTPSGTPTAVGVWVCAFLTGANAPTATYGGTSMSAGTCVPLAANTMNAISFGLASPASGAQTIAITIADSAYPSGNSISVTGSDTTTCFSNRNTNRGSTTGSTVGVTSAAGELVVDVMGAWSANGVPSGAGGSQTVRETDFWNSNLNLGLSTQPGAAGTVTATWSNTNKTVTDFWSAVIDSFLAGPAPPPSIGGTMPMMGVG